MINKSYKDNRNGLVYKVLNVDGNIAILENGEKIAVERLLDTMYFTDMSNTFTINESYSPVPQMDIMNDTSRHIKMFADLENKLANVDFSKVSDVDTQVHYKMEGSVIESRTAMTNYDPVYDDTRVLSSQQQNIDEVKKQQMLKAAIENQKRIAESVQNQQRNMSQYIDDDEIMPIADTKIVQYHEDDGSQVVVRNVDYDQPNHTDHFRPIKKVDDSLSKMISGIKRTEKFNISIKIEELIPNKTLLKLWQDSSEFSLVEYLADDMYNKLMQNPLIIKEQIIEKLNSIINKKGKKDD